MGRKSRLKQSKSSPASTATANQAASVPADEVEAAGGDWQDNEAILTECIEATREFQKGYAEKGLKLIKKAMQKYPDAGLPYRIHASMCEEQCYRYTRTRNAQQCTKYLVMGIESAFKAVQNSPKSIEYVLLFANLFLRKSLIEIKEYQFLRHLCEEALLVEDPLDLPGNFVTVHSRPTSSVEDGGRISQVQRDLREVIKRTLILEEIRKEAERKEAAAKLEQEIKSTGVPRKDCSTSKSTPLTKTADQKTGLRKELPDCVIMQDEQRKEAALAVEQKTTSTSNEAGEARKDCNASGSTPTSEPADHKVAVHDEVHDQVTRDEQRKEAELIVDVAGAGLEQKHEPGEPQRHGSTSESTPTSDPAVMKVIIDEEEVPVTQDEQTEEVEAAHEAGESAPAVEPAGQNIVINEEVDDADDGLPSDQNAAVDEEVDNTEWAPTDDGIGVSLPASPSPSREEILQYINHILYEHRQRECSKFVRQLL